MEQIIMENLSSILSAIVSSLLAFLVWKQREISKQNEARRVQERAEAQARMEQVESRQIEIQAQADSLRATHDHHAELIKHLGRTEDTRNQETQRWRELMDSYRASNLEAARIQATANEHVAQAITNSNSLLEIQTAAYGTLKTTVESSLQTIGVKVDSSGNELRLVKAAVDILTQRINVVVENQDTSTDADTERHTSLKQDNYISTIELGAIKSIAETIAQGVNAILQRMEKTQPIPEIVEPPALPENTDTKQKSA